MTHTTNFFSLYFITGDCVMHGCCLVVLSYGQECDGEYLLWVGVTNFVFSWVVTDFAVQNFTSVLDHIFIMIYCK